jgi:hypothetical protein
MAKTITLSHYDHGPMQVAVWDEAYVWEGKRTWTCPDNEELGSFDDADFDEHYAGEIDAILAANK